MPKTHWSAQRSHSVKSCRTSIFSLGLYEFVSRAYSRKSYVSFQEVNSVPLKTCYAQNALSVPKWAESILLLFRKADPTPPFPTKSVSQHLFPLFFRHFFLQPPLPIHRLNLHSSGRKAGRSSEICTFHSLTCC